MGTSLATGSFDSTQVDDLAAGAPNNDALSPSGPVHNAGAVYLLYNGNDFRSFRQPGSGPIDGDARYVNGGDIPTVAGKVGRVLSGATTDVEERSRRTVARMSATNRLAPRGDPAAPAGAEVIASVVRGPAIIGERTRVVNSYVGPFTSVYHGVEIVNSEIEHSIVLENSKILDVARIADSLIGKDVVIRRRADRMPKALRFMLGDHSEVELT